MRPRQTARRESPRGMGVGFGCIPPREGTVLRGVRRLSLEWGKHVPLD